MITKVKSYSISCDNCKTGHIVTVTGFNIIVDENDAWDSAEYENWHKEGDKHYCPSCINNGAGINKER